MSDILIQDDTSTSCCYISWLLWASFLIGGLKVALTLLSAVSELTYYLTRRPRNLYKEYGQPRREGFEGTWAVVTGASDGIGLAYCKHLAKMGFNIMMVSRSEEKLKAAKQDIEKYLAE